jgi:hypothetical protein
MFEMWSEHLKLEDEAVGMVESKKRTAIARLVAGRDIGGSLLRFDSDGILFTVPQTVNDAVTNLVYFAGHGCIF